VVRRARVITLRAKIAGAVVFLAALTTLLHNLGWLNPGGAVQRRGRGSGTRVSYPAKRTTSATATGGRTGLAHPVFVDTLPETSGDQVTRGAVSIGGRTYRHGLQFEVDAIEQTAEATYSIPRGARTFSALIGNDDHQPNPLWNGISVLYEVFIDDRRVRTATARGSVRSPPGVKVRFTSGATLTLKVTNENGAYGATNADWADPIFR
jgi:hypothetical protein